MFFDEKNSDGDEDDDDDTVFAQQQQGKKNKKNNADADDDTSTHIENLAKLLVFFFKAQYKNETITPVKNLTKSNSVLVWFQKIVAYEKQTGNRIFTKKVLHSLFAVLESVTAISPSCKNQIRCAQKKMVFTKEEEADNLYSISQIKTFVC